MSEENALPLQRKTSNTSLIMANYNKTSIAVDAQRAELHDALNLTGAEVSINSMLACTATPFFHAHKENEEIYGILSGEGKMEIDGELVPLAPGDWLRVAPAAVRKMHADTAMTYLCIQVREGSLNQWTITDAIIS